MYGIGTTIPGPFTAETVRRAPIIGGMSLSTREVSAA